MNLENIRGLRGASGTEESNALPAAGKRRVVNLGREEDCAAAAPARVREQRLSGTTNIKEESRWQRGENRRRL